MLAVRIQAIDGTGTFTLSDSQPCRLLLAPPSSLLRAHVPLPLGSLLLRHSASFEESWQFSLRLDVYSPPQVLQIRGRLCHLVLAFLIMEKLQTEGPLCSADITLLHRSYGPIRHPLAVNRFPG